MLGIAAVLVRDRRPPGNAGAGSRQEPGKVNHLTLVEQGAHP